MSRLFSPISLGPITLANRIAVAPMCQYSAAEGVIQPWHWQHLGRMAISGASVVIVEATGVEAAGRISWADTGLHSDEQEAAWRWVEPIMEHWSNEEREPRPYAAGTWGPSASSAMIARDGFCWSEEC